MLTGTSLETSNRQVLADTFRDLVRYVFRKTARDPAAAGITPEGFSLGAMEASLAAAANREACESGGAPSLKTLLENARERPATVSFYWSAPGGESFDAVFTISFEPDGDLEVRLVRPQPLQEAVRELLRVLEGGRLAAYPPPK